MGTSREEGKGHWTVNYTGTQTFITTLFYLLRQNLWIFGLSQTSSAQKFTTNNPNLQKERFCLSSLGKYINCPLSYPLLSLEGTSEYLRTQLWLVLGIYNFTRIEGDKTMINKLILIAINNPSCRSELFGAKFSTYISKEPNQSKFNKSPNKWVV